MNVVNPEPPEKISLRRKIIYIVIFIICIIAIFVGVYIQFFLGSSIKTLLGIRTGEVKTSEESIKQREEFEQLFNNELEINEEESKYNEIKKDNKKRIIYTGYQYEENVEGKYNINVNLPYINIENETIEKYNKEIKETFEDKTLSILTSKVSGEIYNVNYKAYITNEILSIVIRANLKEGNNPQRQIYKTYNFNLKTNKPVEIKEMLSIKGLEEKEANEKIKEEIKNIQVDVEKLKESGYEIFTRNSNDEMYKIENVKEYFLGKENRLYIIFAYGNQNFTSEKDIVIFN